MTGQAMGGIFASVANIITLAAGTNVIDSGLGFFIAATLTSVLSLLGYGLLYYLVSTYLSRLVGKPTMWFQNRSYTNWAVQAQKMARDWKFCI